MLDIVSISDHVGSTELKGYSTEEKEWLRGVKVRKGRPELPYEVQLVAYIDILGLSEKVRRSGEEASKIMVMMESIRRCVETLCHRYTDEGGGIRLLQIGDGFVFVADFSLVNEMCGILAEIQWRVLTECQELIRGSLTAGNVRVGEDNKFFIGQAIIEAFELERKNAIFPRIICEDRKIEEYVGQGIIDYRYISDDQDKVKYIDYIKYIVDHDGLTDEKLKALMIDQGFGDALRKEYEVLISENREAAQKYGWLFSKLESYNVKIVS